MSLSTWYLEGFVGQGSKIRTTVRSLPFSVGRRSSSDLSLNSKMVSQKHAELFQSESSVGVRDLGSTNGTFVNGKQVSSEHLLEEGDIIHFADLEFRLMKVTREPSWSPISQTVNLKEADLPGGGVAKYRELREMLQLGAVRAMIKASTVIPLHMIYIS